MLVSGLDNKYSVFSFIFCSISAYGNKYLIITDFTTVAIFSSFFANAFHGIVEGSLLFSDTQAK